MKSLKSLAIMLSLAAMVSSCKKDDDDKKSEVGEPSTVLPAEQWKLVAATAQLGEETIDLLTSDYNIFPDCMLDDLITFEEDGTISTDENELICSEGEEGFIQIEGNWTLNEDETVMTIDDGDQSISGPIELDTNKRVELSFSVEISEGNSLPGTLVLEAN